MRVQLPWYYFDFLGDDYANLWSCLKDLLVAEGFRNLPDCLDPSTDLDTLLASPDLLLSQTCGYDLAGDPSLPLQIVGTPAFAAPGCGRGYYVSFVVTQKNSPWAHLDQTEGTRLVANDRRSWSGFHALKEHHARFEGISFSGSHLESLRALNGGRADVGCIDSVSWTLIARAYPELTKDLRVIGQTAAAPAPPIVTLATRPEAEVEAMRRALHRLPRVAKDVCAHVLWEGFVLLPRGAYAFMASRQTPKMPRS